MDKYAVMVEGISVKESKKPQLTFSKMIFQYVFQAHSSEIHFFFRMRICACLCVDRELYMSRRAVRHELTATCLCAFARRLILSAQQQHMNRSCSHNQP